MELAPLLELPSSLGLASVPVHHEGLHEFVIAIDGDEVARHPLPVVLTPVEPDE